MGFYLPSTNDFKLQFPGDFRYAVPGFGAVISLTFTPGGAITACQPLAGGYNYAPNAAVNISDPTGTGAAITATVKGGQLITTALVEGGENYTSPQAVLFGGDDSNLRKVTDDDINGAIADADANINQSLFQTQATFTRAFLWLAAHLLVQNIGAAAEGLASTYGWLTGAKSVDGLSQTFVIPQRIQDDPFLALLSTTVYGANYLRIVMPFMVGHVTALPRQTNPV